MPSYKLIYFDSRARAEVMRLIFNHAGVEFKDARYDYTGKDGWNELKPTLPTKQIPVLEIDGEYLSQSMAIVYYLGRKFGLAGTNAFEEGKVYEVFFIAQEIVEAVWMHFMERDDVRKGELKNSFITSVLPRLLDGLEKLLGEKKYFIGSTITVADLNVFLAVDELFKRNTEYENLDRTVKAHTKLVAHWDRIAKSPNIAEYLEKRVDSCI